MKADKTQNTKWKSKKVYFSDLQLTRDECPDVYEVIICETLICLNGYERKEANCAKAFKIFDDLEKSHEFTEAFQTSVRDGDPDEPGGEFTSLLDVMTTPPPMDHNETVSIDFELS